MDIISNFIVYQEADNENIESINELDSLAELLSTLNINSRVGYHSLDTLSEKFGISKGTLVTYNSELEKRNLISIHRRKTFDESTGKFKSFNNVYFKPCDKEHICNWFKIDLE